MRKPLLDDERINDVISKPIDTRAIKSVNPIMIQNPTGFPAQSSMIVILDPKPNRYNSAPTVNTRVASANKNSMIRVKPFIVSPLMLRMFMKIDDVLYNLCPKTKEIKLCVNIIDYVGNISS